VRCWYLSTTPTGKLLQLLFVGSESFFSYAAAAQAYFECYGKPITFYSDKHGIFRVIRPVQVRKAA